MVYDYIVINEKRIKKRLKHVSKFQKEDLYSSTD